MSGAICWDDERAHFGFYPAALTDDLTNVVLDCAPPRLAPSRRERLQLNRLCVYARARACA